MKKKTTYRAILCNSAGELDFVTADDIETLQRQLGKRLVSRSWILDEGDTIHISGGDTEQVT